MRWTLFVLTLCLLLSHVENAMTPSHPPLNLRSDYSEAKNFNKMAKDLGLSFDLRSSSEEEDEGDDGEPVEQRLLWNASAMGKVYDIELALRESASLEKFNKDGMSSLHLAISEKRRGRGRGRGRREIVEREAGRGKGGRR
eukprot:766277-Hanusia_phi.AAC.1